MLGGGFAAWHFAGMCILWPVYFGSVAFGLSVESQVLQSVCSERSSLCQLFVSSFGISDLDIAIAACVLVLLTLTVIHIA